MFKEFFSFGAVRTFVILLIAIIVAFFIILGCFYKNEGMGKGCEKTICTKDGCFIWDEELNRCGLEHALKEERKRKQIEDKKDSIINSMERIVVQEKKELELKNNEIKKLRAEINREKEKIQKCKVELDTCLKIKDHCKADSLADEG